MASDGATRLKLVKPLEASVSSALVTAGAISAMPKPTAIGARKFAMEEV